MKKQVVAFLAATCLLGITVLPALADVTSSSTIERIAGQPLRYGFSGDGGLAVNARLNKPRDSEFGPDGSLYFVDTFNDRVRRIAPNGQITTVAGNGAHGYNGDNIPATQASLSWPHDLFVDNQGSIFIADSNNHRIREVTPNGIIHTVVGTGASGSTGDGQLGTKARIKYPKTVFRSGTSLFWSGLENRVRKMNLSTGVVSAVAGSTTMQAGYRNGSAGQALFRGPQRMQIDSNGNIYMADTGNSVVRRIDAGSGTVTTVAGTGNKGNGGASGVATKFALNQPRGIALEGNTTLYIADSQNHRIRKVNLNTGMLTSLSNKPMGYAGDGGPVSEARFYQPRGLSISPEGNLVVADTYNSLLREISVR